MPSDFTPNNVWGTSAPSGAEEELTTPTGQTCRAKRMTIESMVETGILAETDAITALVSKHIRKVKGAKGRPDGQELNEAAVLADPGALQSIIGLTDKVLPYIVVSPPVSLHYSETKVGQTVVRKKLTEDERQVIARETPGTVFTDQIGLEDKMFLFDWACGGIKAMTNFRGGSTPDVGGVVPGKGSKKQAKRNLGDS
jgi:hypothetical protein